MGGSFGCRPFLMCYDITMSISIAFSGEVQREKVL